MSAYQNLHRAFRKIAYYQHCLTILEWDQEVMMPGGGAEERANAIAEMSALEHSAMNQPEIQTWLDACADADLTADEAANVREMRRAWQNSNLMPEELVREQAVANALCQQQWTTLRPQNDWAGFSASFTRVVELAREQARIRQQALNTPTPYDAMLGLYSCGDSAALIDETFAQLKAILPEMINTVCERQNKITRANVRGEFPVAQQQQLSRNIAATLGFDFNAGRLDISAHPFSTGNPGDQRITTRYRTDDFLDALFGTVHETGHASYEAGLPNAWRGQPLGLARNMSIHESQSLFFEKHIGTTDAFCALLAKQVQTLFPANVSLSADDLKQAVCWVEPGLIRVSADELSYPLHIIVRHEIESALINGDMAVSDIPDVWSQKMQQYLGLNTQGNNKDGCMQDVHWPSGAFGYFPSYTLGAVNAAQLRAAMESKIGDLNALIAANEFVQITQWLHDNIWQWGSRLESQELMQRATGKPTNAAALITHFERQYGL